MAGTVGIFVSFTVLATLFWLAMAVPTSLIARRKGHPPWIAFVAWCPFLVTWSVDGIILLAPQLSASRTLGMASFFFWIPAAVYLWVLAFSRGHQQSLSG
jgi:hypothetical protein